MSNAEHADNRNPDPRARSAARLGAVQALYQMDVAGTPLEDVVAEFKTYRLGRDIEGEEIVAGDAAHFEDLVRGVLREQREIDTHVNRSLAKGWALARVDSTLRAILRAGAYELRRCKDVPVKVVINEYVDIAHAFFEGDEPGVVNAVLDRMAKEVRPSEGGKGGSGKA